MSVLWEAETIGAHIFCKEQELRVCSELLEAQSFLPSQGNRTVEETRNIEWRQATFHARLACVLVDRAYCYPQF